MEGLTGRLELPNVRLLPGKRMKLIGCGKSYEVDDWFITTVAHSWGLNGLQTRIETQRGLEWLRTWALVGGQLDISSSRFK